MRISLVESGYHLTKSGLLILFEDARYVGLVWKGNAIPKKLKGEFILDDDFATDDVLSSTKEDRKAKNSIMVYLDDTDKAKFDRAMAIQSFLDGGVVNNTSMIRKYIRSDYEHQVKRLVDLGVSTIEKEARLIAAATSGDQD